MKYVVVIALVGLLLSLAFWKLQPYLRTARNILEAVKQFQQTITTGRTQPASQSEKLVQCARCQTWIPVSRGLSSGDLFFCSAECQEARVARN